MEDVAIAYGYDNLPKRVPGVNTVAAPLPINKLSDSARRELALAGFTEVAPLTLVSFSKSVNDTNVKIGLSVYYLSSAPTMKTSSSSTALMMVPRLSSWQTRRLSNTRLSELLSFLEFSRPSTQTESILCLSKFSRFLISLSKMMLMSASAEMSVVFALLTLPKHLVSRLVHSISCEKWITLAVNNHRVSL